MRPLGFTLTVIFVGISGTSLTAQQPGGPLPPAQPPLPPGAPNAAATLDDHLLIWEKTMADIKNLRVDITRTTVDKVYNKEKKWFGPLLLMKPNFAILRLDYSGDPTKQDYEAFLCDGKSLYHYQGLEKTISEFKFPNPATNPGAGTDNFMLDFLSGMTAKDAKARFDLALIKEDPNYVYLSIVPKLGKDQQNFKMLTMALFGPKTKFPYLPCKMLMQNPNGDSETWDFAQPQINIPGINESAFKYVKVAGFREIPAQPPPPPNRPGPFPPGPNGTGRP